MSVPEGKRTTGKLQVLVKARDVAIYTLRIVRNEKIFTPDYQRSMTDDIVACAKGMYLDASEANDIRVCDKKTNLQRSDLQEKAIHESERLLHLIELAKLVYHLSSRRVKFWGSLVIESENLLRSWHDSDKKRYKEYS